MAERKHPTHEREHDIDAHGIRNVHVNYEDRDLGTRGILMFLFGLAVFGVFTFILVFALIKGYNRIEGYMGVEKPVPSTLATPESQMRVGDPTERFPKPVLQPDPVADLNKFRSDTEEILNSYTWVDQKNGVVRIPIERAIDIVAQQGLPVRPAQPLSLSAQFGSGRSSPEGEGAGAEPRSNQ